MALFIEDVPSLRCPRNGEFMVCDYLHARSFPWSLNVLNKHLGRPGVDEPARIPANNLVHLHMQML